MLEQRIEPPGLGRSPGKTIQNIAALTVREQQPIPNHVANQVVRYQLSAGHHILSRPPELSSSHYMLPEEIPCRNLGNAVVLHDSLGLSAFACTRRTEQHNRTHG